MVGNHLDDFTVENGVYKGPVIDHVGNYKSIGKLMWDSFRSHGDKIALLDAQTEETVTYAELQDKIVRCALWLQKQGIKSDDVITVCSGNHLNSIVPCLSVTYVNAIFNTWNEAMNLPTALHLMQVTMPKIIFCSEKSMDVMLSATREKNYNPTLVVFGKHVDAISFSDILKNCSDAEVADFRYVELNDIKKAACILHSSGTTGMPKGVEVSNYSKLYVNLDTYLDMNNVPSLWYSSLYWLTGIIMNFTGIVQGSKMIIYPEFDEEMTCRLIEKYKVATLFLSTSMISRILRANCIKKYSLSSMKMIMSAGTMLKPEVQEELRRILPHVKIVQGYGMTEVYGLITMQLPHHKSGSCGVVRKNVQIKIVDIESGKVLGPNQSGEIWIKSVTIMNGYYRNPEATRNTIDEEGWLHTGDIGHVDEDGELFITNRLKELIKYRGYQISPGEIENVLLTHPAVSEAGIVGVPHPVDDEHPLAYVMKKPGAKVTEQELIDFVAENMMDHCKLRAGVIFLDSFPYTGSGKVSKQELKEMTKKLIKHD